MYLSYVLLIMRGYIASTSGRLDSVSRFTFHLPTIRAQTGRQQRLKLLTFRLNSQLRMSRIKPGLDTSEKTIAKEEVSIWKRESP
jgi:hypothetical protein